MNAQIPPSPRLPVGLRRVLLLALLMTGLLSLACQSEEQKIAGHMESGRASAEAGLHEEAIIEFRGALKIDPNLSDAHFELAQSYVSAGKPSEAFWEFSEAIRLDPNNWDARLKLGAIALMRQDFERSLEQAELAVTLVPDEPTAHVLLGQAFEGLGRLREAEASYRKAVELAPDQSALLFILGRVISIQDRRDEAEVLFVKMTEVDPSHTSFTRLGRFLASDPERDEATTAAFTRAVEVATPAEQRQAYDNLASFHSSRKREDAAATTLEQGIAAIEDRPDDQVALVRRLFEVQQRRGLDDEATALLERAIEIAPYSPDAHLLLAARREQQGDLLGALALAERAAEVAPDHIGSRMKQAEYLMLVSVETNDASQREQAHAILDEVLQRNPTHPEALYTRGRIALVENKPEEAAKAFRASIDSRPESAHAHYMLARTLATTGDHRGARSAAARSLELDPALTPARHLIIQLHSLLGEYEYAIEQGRIYMQRNPDPAIRMLMAQSLARLGRTHDALIAIDRIVGERRSPDVLRARARLLIEDGQFAAARDDLIEVLASRPGDPAALRTLMQAQAGIGQPEAFEKHIASALAADPDNPELNRLRGSYALRQGDLETAERALTRTLELDEGNVAAFRQLAGIYQRTDRVDEAISTYEQALAKQPDSAILHHLLAVLYQAKGNEARAREGYEKAIALDDSLAAPKNNLAYLLAESGTELQRALDLAQEAKAHSPEDPGTADTLGWVLYRRGIPSAAVGYLREALAGMDAGSEQIGVVQHHLALAYEANGQEQLAIETLETSLAELESRQERQRAAGSATDDPEWAASARELLSRLKG